MSPEAQKQMIEAFNRLPEELSQDEFDAMICSIISAYIGPEDLPAYLFYLGTRTGLALHQEMQNAEDETKH